MWPSSCLASLSASPQCTAWSREPLPAWTGRRVSLSQTVCRPHPLVPPCPCSRGILKQLRLTGLLVSSKIEFGFSLLLRGEQEAPCSLRVLEPEDCSLSCPWCFLARVDRAQVFEWLGSFDPKIPVGSKSVPLPGSCSPGGFMLGMSLVAPGAGGLCPKAAPLSTKPRKGFSLRWEAPSMGLCLRLSRMASGGLAQHGSHTVPGALNPCPIVSKLRRRHRLPLQPLPVQLRFQASLSRLLSFPSSDPGLCPMDHSAKNLAWAFPWPQLLSCPRWGLVGSW